MKTDKYQALALSAQAALGLSAVTALAQSAPLVSLPPVVDFACKQQLMVAPGRFCG